ncbi:MAG: (2Fe-2S) ferredoxin domain-containing protein [Bacteroidota bacterium]
MGKNLAKAKVTFYFCDGGTCRKAGSENAIRSARAHIRNKGLWDDTHTIKTRCNGRCENAPTWIVQPGDFWYKEVDQQKAIQIVDEHCDFNRPLESELIFRAGQDKVESKRERPPVATPTFHLVEDDSLGEVFKARGFHSDQYLYPFFLFLAEKPGKTQIKTEDGRSFAFAELSEVDYTDTYKIILRFKNDEVVLVSAIVPKTEPKELIQSRVSFCEYFIQPDSGHKTVRLKDKISRLVAELFIDAEDEEIWKYCLNIQLNNAENPKMEPSA